MDNRRRTLLFAAPAVVLGLAASRDALAQTKLTEADPTATALGYKEDASKVDTAKFKNIVKGSNCSNCNFFQGAATAPTAPCAAFGGKLVVSKGWCTAWVKKA